MYMSGFGMDGMWLWWLLPLLLIAALIYIVSMRTAGDGRSHAMDILDERLAKGDIDVETYQKLKEELKKGQ